MDMLLTTLMIGSWIYLGGAVVVVAFLTILLFEIHRSGRPLPEGAYGTKTMVLMSALLWPFVVASLLEIASRVFNRDD